MTVYIDVLFLVNFAYDYLCLYMTGWARRIHVRQRRYLSVSFIMTLYSLWALLYCSSYILLCVSAFLCMVGAVLLCFRPSGQRAAARTGATFMLFASLLAGVLYGLWILTSRAFDLVEISPGGDYKLLVLCLLSVLTYVLFAIGRAVLRGGRAEASVEVTAELRGRKVSFSALVDSGNRVSEPFSGRGVLFITDKIAARLFSNEEMVSIRHGYPPPSLSRRVRVICVEGMSGRESILVFSPDKLTYRDGRRPDFYIGVHPRIKDFGGYDALAPALP